jgi:hypothetical protein
MGTCTCRDGALVEEKEKKNLAYFCRERRRQRKEREMQMAEAAWSERPLLMPTIPIRTALGSRHTWGQSFWWKLAKAPCFLCGQS